ncbi:molybdopterin-dependent oxidoreductase [Aquincola sp. S2]|uniref:Molybdopterin-dependent oxidoreductase n=1 Tax=Pseudaquabacterium terrae TaxID=2732868 RepID=A0ABX2ENQ9_9BURK|nr:molybdopterin-dependent oxidoreductase [Aquabacterium terrae]NRF70281.1 molybdopterin-dependent oxidoreductase [Aquabacterium terrae]
MNKRHFLAASGLAGLLPAAESLAAAPAGGGQPTLLTVSGAIGQGNRGPFDPALDQMMGKHGIKFDKAFAFDAPALAKLAAVTIKPTLEYDAKPHTLRGPLLGTVLAAAGVKPGSAVQLGLRAVDGYNVGISLSDVNTYRMIVATHIDGQPLGLGGLGPQWAVYEADTVAPFKDKPLKERFGLCPWGLYHIDVKAA